METLSDAEVLSTMTHVLRTLTGNHCLLCPCHPIPLDFWIPLRIRTHREPAPAHSQEHAPLPVA